MRRITIAAVAALAFASAAYAGHGLSGKGEPAPYSAVAPHCGPNNQLCGKNCISKMKVCHRAQQRACNPATSKPCDKTCIALNKVCQHPAPQWGGSAGGDNPQRHTH